MPIESPVKPKKSNEWYTPSYLIEAARVTMGGIDLDPASCEAANATVKAARYFTVEDDGLKQQWGRIWLNPPYGKAAGVGYIAFWIDKAVEEYAAGNVAEAILLVTGDTDTRWFQRLLEYPVCLANRNISFLAPDDDGIVRKGRHSGHIFGTALAYLGPHTDRFTEYFKPFGAIVRRIA
jgi:ParB family transcriptional regulator, chromosome partitioning protein